MPIPIIIQKILNTLDEKEINDTILMYYKSFGTNPKILNEMIKTYIIVKINEKINSWNLINDNDIRMFA
jgi:hypothetical protein